MLSPSPHINDLEMPTRYILLSILSIVLSCCAGHNPDSRLTELEKLSDISPEEACDSLETIDRRKLSRADRHYLDFLMVKASDKAYVTHTSDSLILEVIDYESRHRGNGRYPEALYYGGRVYSDLGDYPSALRYYQNALDLLPATTENLRLRGNVLSQTGRLLNSLRLYKQAIQYMERVIELDSINGDTINLMYDIQLLGAIHLHAGNYDSAESKFRQARQLVDNISIPDVAMLDMYLAAVKHSKGQLDSALFYIRPAIRGINSLTRNTALTYAGFIYRDAGKPDSAYMYSKQLIESDNPSNCETGYQILLSPELKDLIPADSISVYLSRYKNLLDHFLNRNEVREALIQNSLYNYSVHEREREKAEIANASLIKWIICFIALALCLIFIILFIKYRNRGRQLRLHIAIEEIRRLRIELENAKTDDNMRLINNAAKGKNHEEELRLRLRDELLAMRDSRGQQTSIPQGILESEIYSIVQQYIIKGNVIPDTNQLWVELGQTVEACSVGFKNRLSLLTGGKLKLTDYHLALLIKCGISPTNIAILVGKAKGTIAYRREKLGIKIFDNKMELDVIDDIIRQL